MQIDEDFLHQSGGGGRAMPPRHVPIFCIIIGIFFSNYLDYDGSSVATKVKCVFPRPIRCMYLDAVYGWKGINLKRASAGGEGWRVSTPYFPGHLFFFFYQHWITGVCGVSWWVSALMERLEGWWRWQCPHYG